MTDVILAILCPAILAYFVFVGRRGQVNRQKGWGYMLAGLAFMMYGVLISVTDSFFGLDNSYSIVNTENQELIASLIGYFPGFLLLAIGFRQWVPTVTSLNESQKQLQQSRDELDAQIRKHINRQQTLDKQLQSELALRNQIETTLQESEDRFRYILNHALDATCIIQDGLIKYANPQFQHLTGHDPSQLLDTSIATCIHPEHVEKFVANLEQSSTLDKEAIPVNESTCIHKNGNTTDISISLNPIQYNSGHAILMTMRDITQTKQFTEKSKLQSEEIQTYSHELDKSRDELRQTKEQLLDANQKLQESEKELRETFENANDGVLFLNIHGRIIDANSKAEDILGYDHSELIGKNFEELEIFKPAHLVKMTESLNTAAEGVTPPLREFEAKRKDGSTVFINTRPRLVIRHGEPRGILAIIRDITDRKKAELSLRTAQDELGHRIEERTNALAKATKELQFETAGRQQAENMLQEIDARWHALTENSLNVIMVVEHDGTITSINHSIAGMVPQQAIGRTIYEFTLQDYHDVIKTALEQVFQTGEGGQYQIIGTEQDNSYSWYETRIGPVKRNGHVVAATLVAADITERKLAQKALAESDQRFRELADLVPQTIFEIDMAGNFTFANNFGLQYTGYLQEDIDKGLSALQLFVPEDRKRLMEDIERLLKGEEFGGHEYTALKKDGSTFRVLAYSSPIFRDEKIVGIRGIILDITARTQAEEEVAQRNIELAALHAVAQTANESLDLDDILTKALDKMLQILNIEQGGVYIIENSSDDLILRVTRGMSDELMEEISHTKIGEGIVGKVAQSGKSIVVESIPDSYDTLCSPGKRIAFEESSKSLMCMPLQARGNLLGVLFALTRGDRALTHEETRLLNIISNEIGSAIERAQLLEAASRALAAEEADQLRAAFLASISHEIRTPLTEIKGFASTLIQPDIEWDSETQKDFLMGIDQASDQLLEIVTDVLDMAKIEAEVLKLNKTYVRLSKLIRQLQVKFDTPIWRERLDLRLPDELPYVLADEERLGQAITKLVENAALEGDSIILEVMASEDNLILSVTDTGKGIPSERLDKVFDHFHRIEENTDRKISGSGLGLAICKGIIEAHDGEIWIESEIGNGSTFSFSLPTEDYQELSKDEGGALAAPV